MLPCWGRQKEMKRSSYYIFILKDSFKFEFPAPRCPDRENRNECELWRERRGRKEMYQRLMSYGSCRLFSLCKFWSFLFRPCWRREQNKKVKGKWEIKKGNSKMNGWSRVASFFETFFSFCVTARNHLNIKREKKREEDNKRHNSTRGNDI